MELRQTGFFQLRSGIAASENKRDRNPAFSASVSSRYRESRRQFPASLQLMAECARLSPFYGIADGRNVKLLAAGLAGIMLPRALHRWLEGLAGVRVSN